MKFIRRRSSLEGESEMKNIVFFFIGALLFSSPAEAQTGGQFAITQSVIAGGGAHSAGGSFGVTGTIGQPAAGISSTSGALGVTGGFWQPLLAPTAALVSVSGKVTAANGSGIGGVRVSITDQSGETQTAVTNNFGNFGFSAIPAGETYILSVSSRRYTFGVSAQVLSVNDSVNDIVFIADLQ